MVRIPSEYQEVEYIESTGTQYIIADRYLSEDVEVDFKGSYTSYGQRYASLFGAITASNSNPAFVLFRDINGEAKIGGRFGKWTNAASSYVSTDTVYTYGGIFECKCGINWIECEGPRYTDGLIWDNTLSSAKMGLFCRALGDSPFSNSFANGKIYYLTISNDSGIIANFIPCYHKNSGEIGMYDTVTGTFYTNQGTGTFLKGNDVTYDPISLLETRRRILLNTPHIESVSGSIATFNTDISANLIDMKIHFLPVQEGTGDPSPDNVRPIHGWDGVTVTRCGKNLLSPSASLSGVAVRSAGTMVTTDARYNIYVVQVKPNTNYTMKKTGQGYYPTFGLLNKYPELGDVVDGYESLRYRNTYTFNSGDHIYALFSFGVNDFNTIDIQVEEGSTATDYEPYTALEIPISFPQTIYGGYVDLVKGEVVEGNYHTILDGVNHYFTNKEALNNGYASSYEYFGSGSLSDVPVGRADGSSTGYTNLICDAFPTARTAWRSECVQTDNWANYVRLCLSSNRLQDVSTQAKIVESINAWLTENPINICYKLRTPIVHNLTPQTIKALKGINNIWSDANGDVEVKFWKH